MYDYFEVIKREEDISDLKVEAGLEGIGNAERLPNLEVPDVDEFAEFNDMCGECAPMEDKYTIEEAIEQLSVNEAAQRRSRM